MKRILCYGDSNTWGYDPRNKHRFDEHTRWTGILADLLGSEYRVVEDGIVGRTVSVTDTSHPCSNGLEGIGYALLSQRPLDLVVLMIGTNDLKFRDAKSIAGQCETLVERILSCDTEFPCTSPIFRSAPRILLVSPVPVHETVKGFPALEGKRGESLLFPALYREIASRHGLFYLDAAEYAGPSPVDGLHMDPENHRSLGKAVAGKVREILAATTV